MSLNELNKCTKQENREEFSCLNSSVEIISPHPETHVSSLQQQHVLYCDNTDDTVVLEDESGRIELLFDSTDKKKQQWKLNFVTGAIMGIKGKIRLGSSLLEVQDIYYPTLGLHRTISPPQSNENDDEACILLMSRLDCGGNEMSNYHDPTKRHSSTLLKRELLIDYITAGHI